MHTVGFLLAFLAEHYELIEAIVRAVAVGASKESLRAAIRRAEIEASDKIMREELGLQDD